MRRVQRISVTVLVVLIAANVVGPGVSAAARAPEGAELRVWTPPLSDDGAFDEAAGDQQVVLRHPSNAVFWDGGPLQGAFARPESCTETACDEVELDVQVPPNQTNAQLQVAIQWKGEGNDLDLYVYGPDGDLVAQSAAPMSTAESVLAPLSNGTYRVVVASFESEGVAYEGLAQVENAIRSEPKRELMPDLVSLPARRPQIATSAYLFDLPIPSLPTGCYPEETFEHQAVRCLRFDQPIANVGDGPFEVRFRLEEIGTTQTVEQRIYGSDGTWRDRKADTYAFHPTHAHFHYEEFAQARLWRSDAAGDRLGDAPIRTGEKNGFCMLDVELHWWAEQGDGPRTYTPPGGCVAANEIDPAQTKVAAVNGISPGWVDVYFWYVPDQYIEISGVPDGYYLLETIADPMNTAVELDDANNRAFAHIQICGNSVQLVSESAPCSD